MDSGYHRYCLKSPQNPIYFDGKIALFDHLTLVWMTLTLTKVSFLMSFSPSPIRPCVSQISRDFNKYFYRYFFKIGAKKISGCSYQT